MSDQPTCNSENGIDGHCDCKVPWFRDRYLQWVIPGEQPDYEPVEPAGYVYRQGGASPAFYACDRDEADYMLIPIMLGADDA